MGRYGEWLTLFDHLVLAVFVLELATKLFAFRLGFFSRAWNVFDFIIVGIALIPASGPLAVLRALRVLRVLRLISTVPRLRFVVEALLKAVPGISSIAALLNLFIGIIVDTMQTMHVAEHEAEREQIEVIVHQDTKRVLSEMETLRRELAAVRAALERDQG